MAGVEIAYIDESFDSEVFAMSALTIPTHAWKDAFEHLKAYRKHLKQKHGIFTSKEFHATEFVAGRGRIAPAAIPKGLRAFIFTESMQLISSLPGARLISGAWKKTGISQNDIHAKAFARVQERLQKRCATEDLQMILVIDACKEQELTRLARRTRLWNPVGSAYGLWEDGSTFKNIPNDRLIEDPIFKRSDQSYFLQAVDFAVFALLKSEVQPTPRVTKYKIDRAFDNLAGICAKEASRKDPRKLGIVRT